MKNLLIVVMVSILSACASIKKDFVFDGSTIESTQDGISKVIKRLKPAEQIEFMMALMAIQFSDVKSVYDVIDDPTMMNEMNYFIIGRKIDGLNYYGVLDLAKTSPTKVSIESQ